MILSLKDFVAQALKEIIEAVKDVQDYAVGAKAKVNPYVMTSGKGYIEHRVEPNIHMPVQLVNFDVTIVSAEKEKGKGMIGVVLGAIGLGGQVETETSGQHLNRVSFAVPVRFPVQE